MPVRPSRITTRLGIGVLLALLLAAAPAGAATGPTGRVLVLLKAGTPMPAARGEIQRSGGRVAGPVVPELGLVTLRPVVPLTAAAVAAALRATGLFASVELEHGFAPRALPDDPALTLEETDFAAPAGLPLQWAPARSGFTEAWDVTRGKGAVVAVIDTGVQRDHPDLRGKVADALDMTDGSTGSAATDEDGHGTHVASLACAATDDGHGIAGAGWDCRVLALKTDLTDASVAQALVTAATSGAHAATMSFGDDGSSPSAVVKAAVEFAARRDVVLVAAAADEPTREQGEPANLLQPSGTGSAIDEGIGLSVTAATLGGVRASFAGYGSQISLAAYGVLTIDDEGTRGLIGAYPRAETPRESPPGIPCDCRAAVGRDERYAFLAGTSQAVPLVAAAAALLRTQQPALTGAQVVRRLKQTARRDGGWSEDLGWGLLDAGAALGAGPADTRPPSSRIRRADAYGDTVALELRGSDSGSGIRRFEIYRAGRRPRLIARTRRREVRVPLGAVAGRGLYSVATDRAGNREAAPARPDVRISGVPGRPQPCIAAVRAEAAC